MNRLLSYLFPINIHKTASQISKTLEVTLHNGKLILDSKNTNYSYGSLHRVLRFGLKKIGFQKIKRMQNILILGVAGGSVIKTLSEEIGYKGKIKGIELDPQVIEIANLYFGLNKIRNLEITICDAQQFVKTEREKYDLIVIDIFQDLEMPSFLFEKEFAKNIDFLLASHGIVLFNTMAIKHKEKHNLTCFQEKMDALNIYKIEKYNTIFIFHKKQNQKACL